MRKILTAVWLMTLLFSPAIANRQPFFSPPNKVIVSNLFIRTELFFGRNKPDGTEVSEEYFAGFLKEIVTPEFPDGLTVLDGIGQFRDAKGNVIQEKAKVLVLLYSSDKRKQSNRKIELIRKCYKIQFQQESVLRMDSILPVEVSF
jgi:hypothetical protein